MNTPTQLRSVLEDHAGDIDTRPTHDRLGQVQGRIRHVRRRRRAGLAGALAAVVAVAGGIALLPRAHTVDPAAARKDLAGHTAPARLESLGFGFTFTKAVEGDGVVQLKLPASPTPRLVTWAGTGGELALNGLSDLEDVGNESGRSTSDASDFSDFGYIGAGSPVNVTVRSGQGQVALAVYDLGTTPPSMSKDGVFFRRDVVGDRLAGAVIGDPGQTELTMTLPLPVGGLRFSDFCSGVSEDYWVWVALDGDGGVGSTCGGSDQFDPGASGYTIDAPVLDPAGDAIAPGDQVTVRVWLSKGDPPRHGDAPVATDPDARIGLGVYATATPVATVAGWRIAPRVEVAGRVFQFVEAVQSDPGQGSVRMSFLVRDRPRYVVSASTATRRGTLWTAVDGRRAGASFGGGPGGHLGGLGIFSSGTAEIRLTGDRAIGPRTVLALVGYERVD
ncbi:hypothetical protein NOCA2220058 [metagenome]|uniref:Uncharacterized protein n=1 Tax=metagenome TaxID=256318 RepID=A0A2P2BYP0_9ZZZZ